MTKAQLRGILRVEQVGPKEWKFEVPPAGAELDEQFDEGIGLMDEGEDRKAEKIFRAVIKACPLHIDAHHHLAMLLYNRGEIRETGSQRIIHRLVIVDKVGLGHRLQHAFPA